jgi:hypothetical protein
MIPSWQPAMPSNGRKFDLVAFDMDGVLVDYLSPGPGSTTVSG